MCYWFILNNIYSAFKKLTTLTVFDVSFHRWIILKKVLVTRDNNRLTRYFSHNSSFDECNLLDFYVRWLLEKLLSLYENMGPCWLNDLIRDTKKDFNDFMRFVKIKRSNIIKIHTQNEFKYYDIGISKLILQEELLSKYMSSFTKKNIIDDLLIWWMNFL